MAIEAKCSAEDFIKAWQSSSSVDEVAKKTGLLATTCKVRANQYRAAKIPLKLYPAGVRGPKGKRLDVAALALLAAESGPVCDEKELGKVPTKRGPNSRTTGVSATVETSAEATPAPAPAPAPAAVPVRGLTGRRG